MEQHAAQRFRMPLPLAMALSLLILMLTPLLPSAFATAPIIMSFTPSTGGTATSVVITGTDFDTATAVTFGGTAATSFTVDSSTTITTIVGAGTTGVITVTTPRGTGTSVGAFTFVATPAAIYVRIDGSDANCGGTANAAYTGSGSGCLAPSRTP